MFKLLFYLKIVLTGFVWAKPVRDRFRGRSLHPTWRVGAGRGCAAFSAGWWVENPPYACCDA